ncbi:hypothetical protein TNCT_291621 [Trichonephila clavata]|uniref:Uncharacterized protein n=1 Tax=Trichonephila clavata TaxID=2740835 RepID=A0A8X6K8Y8_TRICU|nr:hypothetical protein TNCT_291621 [Trichonephila clavata]
MNQQQIREARKDKSLSTQDLIRIKKEVRRGCSNNESQARPYYFRRRADSRRLGFASTAERVFVLVQFARSSSRRSASVEVLSGYSTGSL